jgi:hypothetical protein
MSNKIKLCRYCQRPPPLLKFRDAGYPYRKDYGPTWVCQPCGAWVGCHPGTTTPLGGLANADLRKLKIEAHAVFDPVWQRRIEVEQCSKSKARRDAYAWLAEQLGISVEICHIGYMNENECKRVIEICSEFNLNQGINIMAPRTKKAAAPAPDAAGDLLNPITSATAQHAVATISGAMLDAGTAPPVAPPGTDINSIAMITLTPIEYAAEVFKALKTRLQLAIDAVCTTEYDITTPAGMKVALALRAGVRDTRTDTENTRVARKEPILIAGRALDAQSASIKERALPLETMLDEQIDNEKKRKEAEAAEKQRIEDERLTKIRAALDAIRELPTKLASASIEELGAALADLAQRNVTEEEFQESLVDAQMAVDASGRALYAMLETAKVRAQEEADRAAAETKRLADIAAQEETNRVAAEKLAAQQRQLAMEKKAIDDAAQAQAELAAAQQALEDEIDMMGDVVTQTTGARICVAMIEKLEAWDTSAARFGRLERSANLVKRTTLAELREILAQAVAEDYDFAVELNAHFDEEASKVLTAPAETEVEVEQARSTIEHEESPVAAHLVDLPDAWEAAAIPASCAPMSASDDEIIAVLMEKFSWNHIETLDRLRSMDLA